MNKVLLILLLLMSLPFVSADMNIDISISENDIVSEDFLIVFIAEQEYDSFDFISVAEPLSIKYDGIFDISTEEEGYIITFHKDIKQGINEVEFTILYDNLIQKSGDGKVLRSSFLSIESDQINISLELPEGFFLSGEPSTSPEPTSITSDGKKINLEWIFTEKGSIVVFYETTNTNLLPYFIILILIMTGVALYLIIHKGKMSRKIDEMLSEDEKKILLEIKNGLKKQKDIAKKLEFSKSKMSKVVRKLEEKGLIQRIPHFKTNILKIKK